MTRLRRYVYIAVVVSIVPIAVAVWVLTTRGVPFLPHGWKTREDWARDHQCFTLRTLRFEAAKVRAPDTPAAPESSRGATVTAGLPADGWGTQIIVDASSQGYALRSAGPDRQFGTPDDLVWPSDSAKKYLAESCDTPWVAHE